MDINQFLKDIPLKELEIKEGINHYYDEEFIVNGYVIFANFTTDLSVSVDKGDRDTPDYIQTDLDVRHLTFTVYDRYWNLIEISKEDLKRIEEKVINNIKAI